MNDKTIKSKLTNNENNKEKVPVKLFKITDIPDVMEKVGWAVSAKFMRKWFYDPFYEMSKNEKLNKVDMQKINKQHIVDDLSFEWLYKASKRVGPVIDNFIGNISYIREYNGYLGRKEGLTDQLSNGLITIISRLERMGLVDVKNKTLTSRLLDFSDLSAMELDKQSQFNYISIGSSNWEKATDELDDVYGALGAFIVKVAFTDMLISKEENGLFRLKITELGLYVRDTYEFMNDGDDQPLGYWGWGGVIKPDILTELIGRERIFVGGKDYYRVTNGSFVQYKTNCNKGKKEEEKKTGDFFVYSTVKKIPVDITIHLNSIDIEEYAARKK